MSDTPRTDAEAGHYDDYFTPDVVSRDFARQLERELAKVREDAERYRWLRSECGRYIDWDELESIDGDISEAGFDDAIDAARREP